MPVAVDLTELQPPQWRHFAHCRAARFTLPENKFIFRDPQCVWMKRKPYRPPPMPLESPGPPLSFRYKTFKKKWRTPWLFLGLGGVKPDNLILPLATYLAPFLVHDAPA
jgi:hypothetical protein